MQYVKICFPSSPHREYTYTNEGDPVGVGDLVDVPSPTGIQAVEVTGISDSAPNVPAHVVFKSIIGKSASTPEA